MPKVHVFLPQVFVYLLKKIQYYQRILQYPKNKGYINNPVIFKFLPFSSVFGISANRTLDSLKV
jgi:hypothetical protein